MAFSGQLLTPAVSAQAYGGGGGGPKPKPKPKPPVAPTVIHGLREFAADGSFTPPAGVTSVHVQAWGGGGGGGGGGGAAAGEGNGPGGSSGGGAGGFTWCVLRVQPGQIYTVDVGTGGTPGTPGTGGPAVDNPGTTGGTAGSGSSTTLASPNGVQLVAGGGIGGGGGGGAPPRSAYRVRAAAEGPPCVTASTR
ncbi:hypothetical protein [Streptomyces sp. NBC_01294]|uniref:hypothetical protein n=1 Tax=Streptomyces sp. NBC_01294 TaxID=2903815 RepID=UPI002DDC4F58|nr:hypothetical protein [Streptomyces sp. NBC_01294]WRZ58549.1 hypothetical protein OG534_19905 [Streptomyces sp. NBC_01294]